jgi:hypothetical protein
MLATENGTFKQTNRIKQIDEDINVGIVAITPALAAEWLEGNVRNRRIDQAHVNRFAADMLAGRWRLTHQGIAFDTSGTLQDGQHRLWAVLQSGATVRMMVAVNVAPENVDALDGGKGRTVVDRMNLSGDFGADGVDQHDLATLREMVHGLRWGEKLAYSKEAQLMELHREAVRFAVKHVNARTRGVNVSYVRAVIARAWYSVDLGSLEVFCRVLSEGIASSPRDAVVVRLRDQLIGAARARNVRTQKDMYGKVERALLAWLRKENLTVLRPVRTEYFPLPEECA